MDHDFSNKSFLSSWKSVKTGEKKLQTARISRWTLVVSEAIEILTYFSINYFLMAVQIPLNFNTILDRLSNFPRETEK